MPVIYHEPPIEATTMLREILREYYPPLLKLKHSLDLRLRFVESSTGGRALKLNGWPCDAICRVVPLRYRALDGPDVLIEVDVESWSEMDDIRRKALLHHEVHHIDVVDLKESISEPGVYTCKLDSLERPKVAMRRHDWQLGGFRHLAEVYGEDAPEVVSLRSAVAMLDQGCFDFMRSVDAEPMTLEMSRAV